MTHKIKYLVLGGLLGAAGVYAAMNQVVENTQQAQPPKQLTYKDIIQPPAGDYGQSVYRTIEAHTQTYNTFAAEVQALDPHQVVSKLDPYGTAPLSALVGIRTEEPRRVEVIVLGNAGDTPTRFKFTALNTVHILPILGLLPDFKNRVQLVTYKDNGETDQTYSVTLQTKPLHPETPKPVIEKAKQNNFHHQLYFVTPSEGEGMGKQTPYSIGLDEQGRIRWAFNPDKGSTVLMKPWKEGKWLTFMSNKLAGERGGSTKYLMAFDLVGRIYQIWPADYRLHHDFEILKDGRVTIATDTDTEIEDIAITVDLEKNQRLVANDNVRMIEHIQPRPIILDAQVGFLPAYDWFHMNGIDENPEKGYRVYSGRNQSATVAINDDNTLRWILADPAGWPPAMQSYLLKPKGEGFEWSWGQHSPVFRDADHLFLFDNGNFRAIDFENAKKAHENYSRLVEYKIHDDRTIEQVWSYGKERGYELYAPYVGGVDYIPETNSVVGVFGGVITNRLGNPSDIVAGTFKNKAHVIEVTHTMPPKVLAEFVFANKSRQTDLGYMIYRGSVCHVYCAYAK